MVRFTFRVNRSFVDGSGHPITIPKSQVSYDSLESLLAADRDCVVVFPDRSRVIATVYQGTAGYGPINARLFVK